jgi:hypothetical protein
MNYKRLSFAIAITACFLLNASAQTSQGRPSPTGLALEIIYFEGKPPAYEPVRRVKLPQGEGTWFGFFGRVAGWHLPAGTQQVSAVRVVPYLDGDAVKIVVSVLRGERFMDSEDLVGTYAVRENESLVVDALKDFGVEPFRMKLIRVAPQTAELPSVLNISKSLEVVGIEPIVSTFPRYKVTLHNLSDKDISALRIEIFRDGTLSLSGLLQGEEGEALVKAGSFYEQNQMLATRAETTAAGFTPASPSAQKIVIASVIFKDGSFEGDAAPAATYRGFVAGNRTELKRIVQLLENALSAASSMETIQKQLGELSYDFDESDVVELAKEFPRIDRKTLQMPVEVAIHSMRKRVVDQLERFRGGSGSSGDFQQYLQGMKDRYSDWLARLTPADSSR